MRNVINTLILALLLPTTSLPQEKVISRVPVRRHPYYGPNVLPALKQLVAERGKSTRNSVKKTLYRWVTDEGKSLYKLMNITYRKIIYID